MTQPREIKPTLVAQWNELSAQAPVSFPKLHSVVPPDPGLIAITRLYLEKYELLADEDRQLYRRIIALIACPAIIVKGSE